MPQRQPQPTYRLLTTGPRTLSICRTDTGKAFAHLTIHHRVGYGDTRGMVKALRALATELEMVQE